jgi:spore cortex biosynthesis protein YabQ
MVQVSIQSQFISVLTMFFCGITISIFFDMYRIISHYYSFACWLKAIGDCVFWFFLFLCIIITLNHRTDGEIHGYVMLSLLIGILFYYAVISRMASRWLKLFVSLTDNLIIGIGLCVYRYIISPIKWIFHGINIIICFFISIAIFLIKIMIQSIWHPLRIGVRIVDRSLSHIGYVTFFKKKMKQIIHQFQKLFFK